VLKNNNPHLDEQQNNKLIYNLQLQFDEITKQLANIYDKEKRTNVLK
jgi:hypothetical protein